MKLPRKFNRRCSLVLFLLVIAGCKGNNGTASSSAAENAVYSSVIVPATLPYSVVNVYPHDPAAFTEGLEYVNGYLYESTGQYGVSDLRRVDLKTGKVLAAQKMPPQYFGEGLTVLHNKIYQLTYREGKGFVYDLKTLKEERSFPVTTAEGWGMTNNGTYLIFDDGTNVLHYIDPVTFKEVKRLAVTDEHGPVNEINEPEMIHGFIYANQWQTDLLLKIDTTTGHVVARADLSSLRQVGGIPPPSGRNNAPDVLNGIAYDATGNRIFVTGKNWPKLFEIRLDN